MLTGNQTAQITLTTSAADAIQELLIKKNLDGYALRVFVSGGGCSGFQYGMALEGNIQENDLIFNQYGVKVVVDEISINYLAGATIDYVDGMMGSGFKIENPNLIAGCDCGSSSWTNDNQGSSNYNCNCH